MDKWIILSSDYVVDNAPYNRTRHDRCRLPNGLEINSYIHEYPDWVNAIVLTSRQELVLVRQYRHGIRDFTLEVPGGMMEEGESAESAIVREVAEETGHRSNRPPVCLGSFYPNPASTTNRVSTWLFLDAQVCQEQELDSTEELNVELVPFAEFAGTIRTGKAPQMFSAMAYFLAKDYLETR